MSAWKKRLLEGAAELFSDERRRKEEGSPEEGELYEQIGRLKMEVEWLKKICPARRVRSDDGSTRTIPN